MSITSVADSARAALRFLAGSCHREIMTHARKSPHEPLRVLARRTAANAGSVVNEQQLVRWYQRVAHAHVQTLIPEVGDLRAVDALGIATLLEGLAEGCGRSDAPFGLGAHLLGVTLPTFAFQASTLQRDLLAALLRCDAIGALATSEARAGSDVSSLETEAKTTKDGFCITGRKIYVTNAPIATHFLVTARTQPGMGARGITVFIVPRESPGLRVEPETPKAGMQWAMMAPVSFENCPVTQADILGSLNRGDEVLRLAMEWERALILAPQLGVMSAQLSKTIDFARTREQSGRPIGRFQGVSHRVADMATRVEASRLMLHRAAEALGTGRDATRLASMAKLFISEAAVQFHLDALRIHGAAGYVEHSDVARGLQDSLGGLFHSGTSEIQRNIVASLLGL